MTVGTRSVLYGAHCFFLHPWFVAWAWWKLYGFPWDPRLWVAFFVHDLGYVGKATMDGPDGETHPAFGAAVMSWLFDKGYPRESWGRVSPPAAQPLTGVRLVRRLEYGEWGLLCLLHSRYYAKKLGLPFSRLCVADKLAIALTPWWLYLPMVNATGEIREYLQQAQVSESDHWKPTGYDQRVWYRELCRYMREWVAEHRDGKQDTWTRADRNADTSGATR